MTRTFTMLAVLGGALWLASPAGTAPGTKTVTIDARQPAFVNTGVVIASGERARVIATGDATCNPADAQRCPRGARGESPTVRCSDLGLPPGPAGPDVPYGALVGRLGAAGKPFYIGASAVLDNPGRLYLTFSDCGPPGDHSNNAGKLRVTTSVFAAQQGRSVVLERVAGSLRVRLRGSSTFRTFTRRLGTVPVGSEVDARSGTVAVTSAQHKPVAGQTATVLGGLFIIRQARGAALTSFDLSGPELRACSSAATSARKVPTRRFFGSGKGRFVTKGRYGSAAIRGTTWGVQDFCDRTFLGDIEGTVEVRDFAKRKTVMLKTGQGYIALA